jgi:hypothetical protein
MVLPQINREKTLAILTRFISQLLPKAEIFRPAGRLKSAKRIIQAEKANATHTVRTG